MNNHCDFVSIDRAYEIIEKLKLTKKQFALFSGLSPNSPNQFGNWEKKGKMPAIRFSAIENALIRAENQRHIEAILNINKLFSR